MLDGTNTPGAGTTTDYTQAGTTQGEAGQGAGGDQQQGAVDWRSSIPAELREAPQLKDVADIGSLAKQFIDQQRFLGNSIRIPGEDAGEPGRKEFLEKLQKHAPELIVRPNIADEKSMAEFWALAGVPEDENDYELGQDVQESEEFTKEAKSRAKKYGMTKKAFDTMVKDRVALKQANEQKAAQVMADDAKSLANEWGASTEAKVNDVKKFAEAMALPQEFQKALAAGRVGSEWIKALDGIIKQFGGMSEGKQVAFQSGGSIPDGPTELKTKIAEIEANPAFRDHRHPQHKILVAKRVEHFKQLNMVRAN